MLEDIRRSPVQDARNGRLAIAEPEEQMEQSTDQRNGDDFQFELYDSTEENKDTN